MNLNMFYRSKKKERTQTFQPTEISRKPVILFNQSKKSTNKKKNHSVDVNPKQSKRHANPAKVHKGHKLQVNTGGSTRLRASSYPQFALTANFQYFAS